VIADNAWGILDTNKITKKVWASSNSKNLDNYSDIGEAGNDDTT